MAEEKELKMEINEAEIVRLITFDAEKKKYIAPCPVEGCGKIYEIGSKNWALANLKRHLTKEHGIEITSGVEEGVSSGEGGIFQRVNPLPAKIRELLVDYAGIDDKVAKKVVELLEKNPVLTENPNNLFNFLSRAKGMDPTLAKNIVDLVFSQAMYEQQMQARGGTITPVMPQFQGSGFTGISPMIGTQGGAFQIGSQQQPQVAYIPNPGGGMTPIIINVPPQYQQGQGQSPTHPFMNIPPVMPPTSDDKYIRSLEDRLKELEKERRGPLQGEGVGPIERVTEKIAMRKIREPIFAEDGEGNVQLDKTTGKPIVLDYREVEEPVFMGPPMGMVVPPSGGGGEDPVTIAMNILEKAKSLFAPVGGATVKSEVDEEKLIMKASEKARETAEGKMKELKGDIEKLEGTTKGIETSLSSDLEKITDSLKDLRYEGEKRKIAEEAAQETYEKLKPFIPTRTEAPPSGLTPQQYAMSQARQIAGDIVGNIRSGFDGIGMRLDKIADAQKVSQMAASMLTSGVPPDQVERIIFQYIRAQMSPAYVEQAEMYSRGSVSEGDKAEFLKRVRERAT